MKKSDLARSGFTLIEMLVVIAVISILATLIFPVTKAVGRVKTKSKARAELEQIATAIEIYKSKRGTYPPDNPGYPSTNQLYYELMGTINNGASNPNNPTYVTPGGDQISKLTLEKVLGHAEAILNSSQGASGDDGTTVVNCLKTGLAPNQVAQLSLQNGALTMKVLVCSVAWPANLTATPSNAGNYCTWRYNSSNPTNNPSSFDLWADVIIGGKTNRICNWSRDALIVNGL
jgi:prepilin-type N-terminal cleavage/methylation domain-containing protein